MGGPVSVLIADDNSRMRITLRNVLSIFDCSITEVETGEDALEEIAEGYFDVIFFDNKLPGCDGIEVIRKIREMNLPVGKIFLLTGYPEVDTVVEAMKLGIFHFQSKKDMSLDGIRTMFEQAIKEDDARPGRTLS